MRAVVVGAGFAGLSTAYHLARAGVRDVTILERDAEPASHASGRNAGMIRQAVEDPVIAALAHEGRRSLERAARNGWKKLFTGKGGSLLTAAPGDGALLDRIERVARKAGTAVRRVGPEAAGRIAPLAEGARIEGALHCPSDGLIDIGVLRDGFVKDLKRRGVRTLYRRPIETIRRRGGAFEVTAGGRTFPADAVVNAAGAWASEVARTARASAVPMKAYRRHLYLAELSRPVDQNWPFVWDLSRELYFRPAGNRLLMSPCDKKLFRLAGAPPARSERPDAQMTRTLDRKVRAFSCRFPGYRPSEAKAALRTMTPDGRFVIGEDPRLRGFFWVAALGGHGVTVCFPAGRLAAEAVLGKTKGPLARAFSPARFAK